jgi:BASS family bile acid:Na+ symporter
VLFRLLRNRDFILLLALVFGLFLHHGVQWTQRLTLPALAVVMTLSTMSVPDSVFRNPRSLIILSLMGILMNYLVLTGFILGASSLLISDRALWEGFVILAAVPPAVAVIPFSEFLGGDNSYSLMGTVGAYLAALVLMPLLTVSILGTGFVTPHKVLLTMVELIVAPLILSRLLIRTGGDQVIEPFKGVFTNWCFFVVIYTVVGLNHDVFLHHPLTLIPVALIAVCSTFILGLVIERMSIWVGVEPEKRVSLILLGTLKNYGLAGGIALTLFDKQTALPATVSTVFMIVYVIWLNFKSRKRE